MTWLAVYVVSMVGVNLLFGVVPLVGSFVVGGIFLVRDAAQNAVGKWVLLATAVGVVLSYFMASPGVALASALAFAAGEFSDYALNVRWRQKTLRERMILTQPVSVLLDTVVFMVGLILGTGMLWSWSMFGVQVGSKMAAFAVLFAIPRAALNERGTDHG